MLGPRVRLSRVRVQCDDECPAPSIWRHPIMVAAATIAMTAFGELWLDSIKRSREPAKVVPPESDPDDDEDE